MGYNIINIQSLIKPLYHDLTHLEKIQNVRIVQISAHGKLLYFVVETDDKSRMYLAFNLGMEGKFLFDKANNTLLEFTLSSPLNTFLDVDSSKNVFKNIYFDDSRRFNHFHIYTLYSDFEKRIQGFDMLQQAIKLYKGLTSVNDECWTNFYWSFKNKRLANRMIYEHLLKQNSKPDAKSFVGVGNYIKSDSLRKSLISPYRTLSTFTDQEIMALYQSILEVMYESYNAGGGTIASFWSPDKTKGKYVFRVYGMEVDNEGNNVVAVKIKGDTDQTTYWCPQVQK